MSIPDLTSGLTERPVVGISDQCRGRLSQQTKDGMVHSERNREPDSLVRINVPPKPPRYGNLSCPRYCQQGVDRGGPHQLNEQSNNVLNELGTGLKTCICHVAFLNDRTDDTRQSEFATSGPKVTIELFLPT